MANEILDALVRFNLAAGAAIVLILVLRKPVRAFFGAREAYALWLIAPVAALATLLPARRVIELAPSFSDATSLSETTAHPSALTHALPSAPAAEVMSRASITDWIAMNGAMCVVALWALGAVVALGLMLRRQHLFMTALGNLQRTGERGVLRATRGDVGPAVVGAIRPRIVVPVDFETQFDPDERALILAHERMHVARGDAHVNGLLVLTSSLLWFNPLVHVASFLIRQDQECACDADVLTRAPEAKRSYAKALLKMQTVDTVLPVGCAWGAHPLRERIALLNAKRTTLVQRAAAVALITTLGGLGGAVAWASQPAVHESVMAGSRTAQLLAAAPEAPGEAALQPTTLPASASAQSQTFANMPIELTGIAARLRVIPESRSDIEIAITAGNSETPRASAVEGRLIVDGGLGETGNNCRARYTGSGAELPLVVIRAPRSLSLIVRGRTPAQIGDLESGAIRVDGCGDARIGAVAGDLRVSLNGYGDVDVGVVGGALTAQLHGLGDLTIASAHNDARLDLIGEGNLNVGDVAGSLSALMQGSGDLDVANVGRGGQLRGPGSGRVLIGAMRGDALTIAATGSSVINIESGEIGRLTLDVAGSTRFRFGGHAGIVEGDIGGGVREVRIASADQVDTHSAPGSGGDIIIEQ